MPSIKKSAVKTGQEGAKATAVLKTLRRPMPPNRTGFLPNLKYKYHRAVSATTTAAYHGPLFIF